MMNVETYKEMITSLDLLDGIYMQSSIDNIVGMKVEISGLSIPIGSVCKLIPSEFSHQGREIYAEVVGMARSKTILMPYQGLAGLKMGDLVEVVEQKPLLKVGDGLLGRVINAKGEPIDSLGELSTQECYPFLREVINPLDKEPISEPLYTGVKAIDTFAMCAKGQRLGIFSGSGVGKSMLLGMIARFCSAPIVVVALVGERGREVNDFIEKALGKDGLKRAVVVVATSEESPLMRVKAPFTATAIAEYFKDKGYDVVLLLDSLTRMAYAQREIGLTVGEPPATKGYPPSLPNVFSRLLERAGKFRRGSITGFYTVLVEADDINEPVADTARSILDGHIWLSRDMANRGIFPAVDVLNSISRLMVYVATKEHKKMVEYLKTLIATYKNMEDLINIGAYQKGANPLVDTAISKMPQILDFIRQDYTQKVTWQETLNSLIEICK